MKTTDKAAQKHGWTSVPVSIAGLSESGVNAGLQEETPCSNPELVVRECGLMLYVDVDPCFRHWYCFRNFQAPGRIAGRA